MHKRPLNVDDPHLQSEVILYDAYSLKTVSQTALNIVLSSTVLLLPCIHRSHYVPHFNNTGRRLDSPNDRTHGSCTVKPSDSIASLFNGTAHSLTRQTDHSNQSPTSVRCRSIQTYLPGLHWLAHFISSRSSSPGKHMVISPRSRCSTAPDTSAFIANTMHTIYLRENKFEFLFKAPYALAYGRRRKKHCRATQLSSFVRHSMQYPESCSA